MVKKYAQSKYNVSICANRKLNKTMKYIVVHYTGTTASAKNNCKYFRSGNRNASADYFIDTNGKIYKFNANCKKYYTWHCGDGYGRYGITNANSIGIEVVSSGKDFTSKQKASLRNLVRAIMADFSVPASRVVRHYDASRKCCPAPYCGTTAKNNKWKELHSYITKASITSTAFKSYKVKVTKNTSVYKGAGTSTGKTGITVKNGEVYTIIGEKKNGSTTWLQLKSGAGYISSKYTEKV